MRIVAISMVKNESDIIESFVRHHAPLFDAHYILDNRSADSTLAILQRLESEGLPLVVIRDPEASYDQSRKMTELMRRATAETDADVIVPLDADEFLLPSSRTELHARLAVLGRRIGLLRWFDYIATRDDDKSEGDPIRRISHRIEPAPARYKACVPRHVASRQTAWLTWGQHGVEGSVGDVAAIRVHEPLLAHFPIRSGSQLVTKAIIGRLALRASHDWKPQLGVHWDRIAQSIKQPSAVSEEEVYQATILLSDPPSGAKVVRRPLVPLYPSLRYSSLVSVDPLQCLLAFTSQLIDDELHAAAGRSGPSDDHASVERFAMTGDWRRRWQDTVAECALLREEVGVLSNSRKHAVRVLARSMWRAMTGLLSRGSPP